MHVTENTHKNDRMTCNNAVCLKQKWTNLEREVDISSAVHLEWTFCQLSTSDSRSMVLSDQLAEDSHGMTETTSRRSVVLLDSVVHTFCSC